MAREVLLDGRDVVVPHLLTQSEFLDKLDAAAERSETEFREVWLRLDPDQALERRHTRSDDGLAAQMLKAAARRSSPACTADPPSSSDDVDATDRDLLALLGAHPGPGRGGSARDRP